MATQLQINQVTGKLDKVINPVEFITHANLSDMPDTLGINSDHDVRYVNVTGDTMTGDLKVRADIYLKAGQKLYFDGA